MFELEENKAQVWPWLFPLALRLALNRGKSLTEYVEKRGLNYTSEDIEDMSWNGTEKSKQFKAHFDELSRKNGTSAETEISSWRQRVGKIARDYGTPQEKSNVEPDSTKKNDNPPSSASISVTVLVL